MQELRDVLVAVMDGVSEYSERYPVELRRDEEGRLVVRAVNEGGHNVTEIDARALLLWLTDFNRRNSILESK